MNVGDAIEGRRIEETVVELAVNGDYKFRLSDFNRWNIVGAATMVIAGVVSLAYSTNLRKAG